ncbi:MAG: hypothetical protein L3J56_03530 [Bacteroidales bacterium]|nr:hypothetical protein [Bacteroidales bacterium]
MVKRINILLIILFSGFLINSQTAENNLYQKVLSEYLQKHYEQVISILNTEDLSLLND